MLEIPIKLSGQSLLVHGMGGRQQFKFTKRQRVVALAVRAQAHLRVLAVQVHPQQVCLVHLVHLVLVVVQAQTQAQAVVARQ